MGKDVAAVYVENNIHIGHKLILIFILNVDWRLISFSTDNEIKALASLIKLFFGVKLM